MARAVRLVAVQPITVHLLIAIDFDYVQAWRLGYIEWRGRMLFVDILVVGLVLYIEYSPGDVAYVRNRVTAGLWKCAILKEG